MAAEVRHHNLPTDHTTTTGLEWPRTERLRTTLLVGAYVTAHVLGHLAAVSLTVTLAAILPGGVIALVGTIVGGLGLIAAAPILVRRGFATALDARDPAGER